jgi:hypothetical protein
MFKFTVCKKTNPKQNYTGYHSSLILEKCKYLTAIDYRETDTSHIGHINRYNLLIGFVLLEKNLTIPITITCIF